MNLLAEDIYSNQKVLIGKVLIVIKHLRNHLEKSAQMKNLNMPRPPVPCETRWNSVADTLRYFHELWSNIVLVINTAMKNTDHIYRFMEDVPLKRAVTVYWNFLSPLESLSTNFRATHVQLAVSCKIWNGACAGSPVEYAKDVAECGKAALTPEILVANLRDHRYGGKVFNQVENASARECLNEIDNDIMGDVTNYMAKEPPYAENFFGESYSGVKPSVWWMTGRKLGFSESFVRLLSPSLGVLPPVPASNGNSPR